MTYGLHVWHVHVKHPWLLCSSEFCPCLFCIPAPAFIVLDAIIREVYFLQELPETLTPFWRLKATTVSPQEPFVSLFVCCWKSNWDGEGVQSQRQTSNRALVRLYVTNRQIYSIFDCSLCVCLSILIFYTDKALKNSGLEKRESPISPSLGYYCG